MLLMLVQKVYRTGYINNVGNRMFVFFVCVCNHGEIRYHY